MDSCRRRVINCDLAVTKKSQPKAKQPKKAKPASKQKTPTKNDELRLEELDQVSGGTVDLSLAARELTGSGAPNRGALSPYIPILVAAKLKQ